VAASRTSDAGSSSTASLPLVTLSVRFTESAWGKEGSRASVACACAAIVCARRSCHSARTALGGVALLRVRAASTCNATSTAWTMCKGRDDQPSHARRTLK
jgi:hypothetical protein